MKPGHEALLPCPFCGDAKSLIVVHVDGTVVHPAYFVQCDNCGACGPTTDRGDHRSMWNARAASPEHATVLAENAALRAQVEAQAVPGWIKTSERRPVENQQVFICIVQPYLNAPTKYSVSIAYFYKGEFRESVHALHRPSHWMPLILPGAPAQAKEGT